MPASRLDPSAKAGLSLISPNDTPPFYVKVARSFLKDSEKFVEKLKGAQVLGPKDLKHIGHTWKSNSSSMGATHLGELCARLEAATELDPALLQQLLQEYALVKAELETDIASYGDF